MSWFTIIVGTLEQSQIEKLKRSHPQVQYEFRSVDIYILSGGINETTLLDPTNSAQQGNILCGITFDGDLRIVNDFSHVENIVARKNPLIYQGSYAGAVWNIDTFTFFNDSLGLRDLYYLSSGTSVIVSTHPYLAACLSHTVEIDFRNFGSRWLLFGQVGLGSVLKNVSRLRPGEMVTVSRKTCAISSQVRRWEPPETRSVSRDEIIDALSNVLLAPQNSGLRTSLGMSGGIDSRLLLSLYLGNDTFDKSQLAAHTFGSPENPDAIIASKICAEYDIRHKILHDPLPGKDEAVKALKEYISNNLAGKSATTWLQQRYYDRFDRSEVVVEGTYGELFRRQYFNRLLYRGKSAIVERKYDVIFQHLTQFRGDFFSREINAQLYAGAIDDIRNVFDDLPDPNSTAIEDWIDLLVIRSKIPNTVGFEQARLDMVVRNIMPFVFSSVLQLLLNIELSDRKKGRLFRKILRSLNSKLTSYPLVKNDIAYPYALSGVPAHGWVRAKHKLGLRHKDSLPYDFLFLLKEFVYDLFLSKSVQECALYDRNKLKPIVENFYKGKEGYLSQLDWWLTFEMWRRSISGAGF